MMMVIATAVTVLMVMMLMSMLLSLKLGFKLKIIHHDGAVFCIAVDTLHAVIADLVWIQVAAVAFAAADALFFFQYTLFL